MSVVYYISSHGFGHAMRSANIINAIPPEIPVVVRTEVRPSFLHEEIHRPFHLEPASFDCGCVQTDSLTIDGAATLEKYGDIHRANSRRISAEVNFLSKQQAHVVVTDIASFPLAVARAANLPGLAVGNFTWGDIYKPFVQERPSYRTLLEEMTSEYEMANLGIKLPLALPMEEFSTTVDVPLVARKGSALRPALAGWLDVDFETKWCLVYFGQYGLDFDWERLARIPGWTFFVIGKEPAPAKGIAVIDPQRFDIPDVLASCQAILGKPGYGTVADAMANDVPFVFTRPTNFCEADGLAGYLEEWGRAIEIDRPTFLTGDVLPSLNRALDTSVRVSTPLGGAEAVAQIIEDAIKGDIPSRPAS